MNKKLPIKIDDVFCEAQDLPKSSLVVELTYAKELEERYKYLIHDTCDTDTYVRERVKGILTEKQIDGNSYCVPSLENIVDSLCKIIENNESMNTLLKETVKEVSPKTEYQWLLKVGIKLFEAKCESDGILDALDELIESRDNLKKENQNLQEKFLMAEDERVDIAKQLQSEIECHAKCQNERDDMKNVLMKIAKASHFDNIGNWARNIAKKALEDGK